MASTRITQGMINTQMIRNLGSNLNRMNDLQNQLASGRRINKPSDDPVGISYAMRYRSELASNDQYHDNVESATSWLEYTDSTLENAGDVLQRIRELNVQANNGSNPQSALDAIKNEVEQLYGELVSIGNSDFNGKHVFNGQKTDIGPYTDATAVTDVTDNEDIKFEIGVGVRVAVNVSGNKVFGSPEEPDSSFAVIQNLITSLGTGDFTGMNDALGKLDTRITTFLGVRSEIGAKMNRVQLADERLKDININLQTLQSNVEDVDVAEAMTNLKTSQNVYQASLSIGSQIIRPSLVDFLK
jgi:flagellar hook-associated protein 3 FlgL